MCRIVVLLLVAVVGLGVIGCSEKSGSSTGSVDEPFIPGPLRTPAELTAQEQTIVDNTNEFAIRFLQEVCARTSVDSNVFISPLSASLALSLALNGAAGPTRDSMMQALSLDGMDIDQVNQGYYNLARILVNADPAVSFTIANSVWSRLGKRIQPTFLADATQYYGARAQEIDISRAWAADTINQWVKDNTNNKIDKMVEPPLDFAALLLNAIYFKGNWRYPFDTTHTRQSDFHLPSGEVKPWQMMSMWAEDIMIGDPNDPELNPDVTVYADTEIDMISLPYGDEGFEMLVISPKYGATVDDLVSGLTSAKLRGWIDQLHIERFGLEMPRLKFGFLMKLNDPLKALGMEIAFDADRADFGNLFADGVGWIDEVKQKSFVQVDEFGTEAAVVTSVSMVDSMPPYIDCTRPFLFMIREKYSGSILFMAKIAEPVWEN